ncbi:hypothetical protein ACHAWT_007868 [Skeletonema menzelii]
MDRQDKDSKKTNSLAEEEAKLLKSLGLLHLVQESQNNDLSDVDDIKTKALHHHYDTIERKETLFPSSPASNKILLGIGGTLFLLPHLFIILSLPPVLQRRGAPYLPTFANKLNVMFDLIKNHVNNNNKTLLKQPSSLKFVDLGSGDGRVVFRAAREGIFQKSVGYEINPALHMWVKFRQLITPKYWSSTEFYLGDLWKIKLHKYDVVAVYGLYPIMTRLGMKLQDELKPGSLVVSNVFEIPGWRASTSIGGGSVGKGVYLYQVPGCYRHGSVVTGTQDLYSKDNERE